MRRGRGFSLIELSVAFCALFMLSLLFFEARYVHVAEARRARCRRDAEVLHTARALYWFEHGAVAPANDEALRGRYLLTEHASTTGGTR